MSTDHICALFEHGMFVVCHSPSPRHNHPMCSETMAEIYGGLFTTPLAHAGLSDFSLPYHTPARSYCNAGHLNSERVQTSGALSVFSYIPSVPPSYSTSSSFSSMLQTDQLIPMYDSVYMLSPTLFIESRSTGGAGGVALALPSAKSPAARRGPSGIRHSGIGHAIRTMARHLAAFGPILCITRCETLV